MGKGRERGSVKGEGQSEREEEEVGERGVEGADRAGSKKNAMHLHAAVPFPSSLAAARALAPNPSVDRSLWAYLSEEFSDTRRAFRRVFALSPRCRG